MSEARERKRMTSKELAEFVQIVAKWGWGMAIPLEDEESDPVGGMIIGSAEFLLKVTNNNASKYVYFHHKNNAH